MKPTETNQSSASKLKAGFSALLRFLFGRKGTSAISYRTSACRTIFIVLLDIAIAAWIVVHTAPALAAGLPEKPVTSEPAGSITPTSAVFEGTLNPLGKAKVGGYFAFSSPEGLTCAEGPTVALEGFEGEQEVQAQVVHALAGLEPLRTYKFCLVAYNESGATPGNEVSVTTPAAPPTILSASASVTSKEATLNAQVNPNNEATSYVFEYSKTEAAGKLTGTIVKVDGASALENFGEQTASVSTGAVLTPGTTYYYRVVAENAQSKVEGKPVAFPVGSVQSFTAVPTPHTEAPSPIGSSTATFNGKLTLDSIETQYSFDYNVGAECVNGSSTPNPPVEASSGTVSSPVTELQPSQKYTVCLVTSNIFGSEVGNAVPFTTKPAAPTVESESVSSINAGGAHLEGSVNPNNQLTECKFEYGPEALLEKETKAELCSPSSFPASFGGQGVSLAVGGLEADKTYYYRILATNATGETKGTVVEPIKHFTTATSPETPEVSTPEPITGTEEVLKGVVNPNAAGNPGTYQFVYEQSASECRYYNKEEERYEIINKTEAVGSLGEAKEAASFKLEHLLPNTTYTFCLIAKNEAGEESPLSSPDTFTTLTEPPAISSESVTEVQYTAATLNAQVDPGGAETHYYFQYGPTDTYGTSTKEAVLGGSLTTSDLATATITGLTPGSTYHYHVVATNSLSPAGGTPGRDETFTTPAEPSTTAETCPNEQRRAEQPFGLTLPDCRAYELVSPEETGGQDAVDSFTNPNARTAESSANPAITYASEGSFGEPAGAAATDQFVSRRNAAKERWETQAVTPLLNPEKTANFSSFGATVFTPELEAGIALTDASLLNSGAPENDELKLYVSDFATGSDQYVGPGVVERPWGASTDLSHVVFGVGAGNDETVSEWVDGKIVPVSVTNEDATIEATVGSQVASSSKEVWHAVSSSGSRVYFSSPTKSSEGAPVLYLRENAEQKPNEKFGPKGECLEPAKACTVEVDTKEEGAPGPSGGGRYWGANAEGERVFFTDENQLTKSSTSEAGDPDLYEYQIEPGHLYGHLTDLTSEATVVNAGEHADVQGVVQISEDGSYVYFVANGVLTKEPNARGETATTGTCVPEEDGVEGRGCNMYVWHDGTTRFIATLPEGHKVGAYGNFVGGDRSDWDGGYSVTEAGPELNTAVVNPAGSQLAFLSERSLPTANFPSGYDNEQAEVGDCEQEIGDSKSETGACREVFTYDAPTNLATEAGTLACASCDPTGARPVGPSSFDPHLGKGGGEGSAQYRPRNLLADGTLFFDSSDALTPHASDGRQNVYEYEEGQIHVISNVAGGGESFFLDASPSGEDVFFGSANKLLPQDTGDNVVVWDARQDGGFPVAPAAPSCDNADSCKPPESSQPAVFGLPASATFSGPGNATPAVVAPPKKTITKKMVKCKKGDTKNKKGKCVRKKSKKKAKRASPDRRTNS